MYKKLRNNSKLWSRMFWGWIILVVLLTALPINPNLGFTMDDFWMRPDYVEHFTFYFVLGFLFYPFWYTRSEKRKLPEVKYWFLAGFIYAVITEIYQLPNPYRSFSYWDMMLNVAGMYTGVLAGYYMFRSWRRQAGIMDKVGD